MLNTYTNWIRGQIIIRGVNVTTRFDCKHHLLICRPHHHLTEILVILHLCLSSYSTQNLTVDTSISPCLGTLEADMKEPPDLITYSSKLSFASPVEVP